MQAIKQRSSRNGLFVYKIGEFNMIYELLSLIPFVAIYALLGGPALTISSWLGNRNQFIEPGQVTVGDWWLLTVTYRHWWLVSVTDGDLPWSTRVWRSDQKFIVRTREGQLKAVKLLTYNFSIVIPHGTGSRVQAKKGPFRNWTFLFVPWW